MSKYIYKYIYIYIYIHIYIIYIYHLGLIIDNMVINYLKIKDDFT